MELIDLLNKGGILVWPILLCSLLGTTIFIERNSLYKKVYRSLDKNHEMDQLYLQIASSRTDEARKFLQEKDILLTAPQQIVFDALSIEEPDRETLEMVLVHGVEKQISILSETLATLAVIASVAPLLGLLGTVFGMIKAFMVVEKMSGSVNAAVLAGGIWEAMLTTAFGLLAAIPLLFFHNHLESKLIAIQTRLEEVALNIMKAWSTANKLKH